MDVELLLEESVHGRVQVEWESRRPPHPESTVEIEAHRTVEEEVDLRTAYAERLFALRIKEAFGAAGIVEVGHAVMLAYGNPPRASFKVGGEVFRFSSKISKSKLEKHGLV